MKKLTAGIFSVLLGAVSVSAADAAITSKKYVDDKLDLKADVTTVNTLTQTVADNKTAADNAIKDVSDKVGDESSGLTKKVADLEGTVGNSSTGLVKDLSELTTKVNGLTTGDTSVAGQIANALKDYTTTEDLQADYAKKTTTLAGYGITDAYTKTEADAAFDAKGAAAAVIVKVDALENGQVKTNKEAIESLQTGKQDKLTAGTNITIADDGTISATDTTYSTGTASESGLTKLYTGTGENTDGTMTQAAITTAVNAKVSQSAYDTQIGTVSAENMGTSATTVVAAIKEVKDIADAAIADFEATGGDGKYVFTAKVVGDQTTYKWEQIERGTGEVAE